MPTLGEIRILDYLEHTQGEVTGRQISDAKDRMYRAVYTWQDLGNGFLAVKRTGSAESVIVPAVIPLNESLVAFFGLYSGDGAKGSEDPNTPGKLITSVSFSQREPNLVKFAVQQFKRIFPNARFVFSLGEDSAYFMAGDGLEMLMAYYGGALPEAKMLSEIRPALDRMDNQYLLEKRHTQVSVQNDLAFFYQHKKAMETILTAQKERDIAAAGIVLTDRDSVTASLRRPFKKGAREPGGSSRSDETHVGGVTGMGELFLRIMHDIEETVQEDHQTSAQGLVRWNGQPSSIGEQIDIKAFYTHHPYGCVAGKRPTFEDGGAQYYQGVWKSSKKLQVAKTLRITPLWCYTAGLYLAEGTSQKHELFAMYRRTPLGFGIGFTSSEGTSLELIIRALQMLFPADACVETWKIKVGSQYFPELVVVGLKQAVPMLRGGKSGDGKLRTMEISLAIKDWALEVAPIMRSYEHRFSHVEPTGAGVPRIDFSASSALCRWYFPLIMYTVFAQTVSDPTSEFAV